MTKDALSPWTQIGLDDNALYRHKNDTGNARPRRSASLVSSSAIVISARQQPLRGQLAWSLAMATMDIIRHSAAASQLHDVVARQAKDQSPQHPHSS